MMEIKNFGLFILAVWMAVVVCELVVLYCVLVSFNSEVLESTLLCVYINRITNCVDVTRYLICHLTMLFGSSAILDSYTV